MGVTMALDYLAHTPDVSAHLHKPPLVCARELVTRSEISFVLRWCGTF
jgi:hypothetical protein